MIQPRSGFQVGEEQEKTPFIFSRCSSFYFIDSGKYYNFIEKAVDCKALFENDLGDLPSEFPSPPRKFPKYLREDFTYNGRLEYKEWYKDETERDDKNSTSWWTNWTQELICLLYTSPSPRD